MNPVIQLLASKWCKLFCTILMLFISVSSGIAQTNYLSNYEKKLTPSPMVGSLGNYGGLEIKKSTGGIQKSINLLNVKEGDLSYSPSLEYFSTGIRVDDYGSRVGIGWTENTTAVISRVVKGVPDEQATGRTGDGSLEFGEAASPDFTNANYLKVRDLSLPNTNFDGEHDEFNFNIFGKSGRFIIRNNQAVLLTGDQSVKIDVTTVTSGYQFLLTDANGVRYFFDGPVETTQFSNDNNCDIDNPYRLHAAATAWFLNKMRSASGHEIQFHYDTSDFSYVYDYHESYVFFNIMQLQYVYQWYCGSQMGTCGGTPSNGSKTSCARSKTTHTQRLSSVTGDDFAMYFDYTTRNDIHDDKLLQHITLQNNNSTIKDIYLDYEQVTATSTIETGLAAVIENDPWLYTALKTRYFLKDIKFGIGQNAVEQQYNFSYLNPYELPHRFSFAQDYLGYYNGKANAGLVPQLSIADIDFDPQTPPPSIPFANRDPDLIGRAGLLSKIVYPTGGNDTIIYEQNQFRTTVHKEYKAKSIDYFSNPTASTYSGSLFEFHVPISGPVNLKVDCYYDSNDPKAYSEEEYWADIELWGNSGHIPWPDGRPTVPLHLGRTFNSTSGLSNPLTVNMNNNEDYWLVVNIYGQHTALRTTLSYVNDVTDDLVDSTYMGYRVKKVATNSLNSPPITKTYNYNTIQQANDGITFTDASSMIWSPLRKFNSLNAARCEEELPPSACSAWGGQFYMPYFFYTLLAHSNESIDVYGGMPYTYKNVTEFQDEAQTSFVTSVFGVTQDSHSWRVMRDLYKEVNLITPDVENVGWNTGLELKRYYGGKVSSNFKIDREMNWLYSDVSSSFFNYSVTKMFAPTQIYGSANAQANLQPYLVRQTAVYTHWTKLDALTQIDYFRNNGGYRTVSNNTVYRYNATDKMVEEEENTNSNNETLLKLTYRPDKMVALNRDPSGIYQGMVINHILPEIEVTSKRNGTQTGLVRTNYYQPFTGLYVPQTVETQQATSDPVKIRLKYLRYDTRGNVLSLSKDAGPAINYIWSYKGKYPVAKIVNADYSAIENTLGVAAINNFANTYPIKSDVDNFLEPLKVAYPAAMISGYSYIPHIGVKSQTDPKGLSTYYIYDSYQRLESILDQNGSVVKSYLYNFKQP